MRHAFTWYEVLIVLVVLAIVAAIAAPNLIERHMSATAAAAARRLKSGFLPGMWEFQSKAYSDIDHDGRGEFARDHRFLAGATATTPRSGETAIRLALLPSEFNAPDGVVVHRYRFQIDTDIGTTATSVRNAESHFGTYAVPATRFDGRRAFVMTERGVVFASKQAYQDFITQLPLLTGGVAGDNTGTFTNVGALLLSDPRCGDTNENRATAAPYGI